MKGKALRRKSLQGKIAASVLLMMFAHSKNNCHQYKTFQKTVTYGFKEISIWSYIEFVIFSDTSGPGHKKKFYNFVKHKNRETIGIATFNPECQTHSDAVSKANILNKQFESVCSTVSPLSSKQ